MTIKRNGEVPLLPEDEKHAPARRRLVSRKVAGLLAIVFALITIATILLCLFTVGGGDQPMARSRGRRTITRPLEYSKYRKFFEYYFEQALPRTEEDFARGGSCELRKDHVNPCEEEAEPCIQCRQDHAFLFYMANLARKDVESFNISRVEATGSRTLFPDGIIGYLDMRRCDRIFSPFSKARYMELCSIPEELEDCYFQCARHLKPLLELYENKEPTRISNGNYKY